VLKFSVVIPTRNRPEWVRRCIDSLLRQNPIPYEIIVVDASSQLDTENLIKNNYNFVGYYKFLNGFNQRPKSKNIGICKARGDILAFLDDDSLVQKDWIKTCLDSYSNDNIGAVGGRVIDINDPNPLIQIGGNREIGRLTFSGKRINNFNMQISHVIEVDHLRGGNISIRRHLLELMGGYDTYYIGTNVFEETDLCVRIKKLGYHVVYNSDMLIEHHFAPREKIQRNLRSFRTNFYIARNGTYFMFINFSIFRSLFFLFTDHTGIPALIKQPSFTRLLLIFIYFIGKVTGIFACIKNIFTRHRRGAIVKC